MTVRESRRIYGKGLPGSDSVDARSERAIPRWSMIKIKRVYDDPTKSDGVRILVDRLWPRGLSKGRAQLDLWLKDAAPSDVLRRWFGHDPARWDEFKDRYFEELANKEEAVTPIVSKAARETVTLLFGAKDEQYNNAVALKEFIDKRMQR
jgi:uncharacterized protein YeaO (DUF488 family)